MVLIPKSFQAFMFQSGVDTIRDAFTASIGAMKEAERKAEEALALYVASGKDDTEYDENGSVLHSTYFLLAHKASEMSIAAREVRRAFIMSAFHYWERSARGWTNLDGQHDYYGKLKKEAAKQFDMSPKLDELNHLNNVLKHNNPYHARSLAMIRLDHFVRTPYSTIHNRRVTWTLALNDAHVEEAIEIVRASGPQQDATTVDQ